MTDCPETCSRPDRTRRKREGYGPSGGTTGTGDYSEGRTSGGKGGSFVRS